MPVLVQMSRIVRKPDFCLCENKGADQLRGNREADQRLCFRYSDSTIFATRIVQFLFYLNPKLQASSSFLSLYRPVCVGPGRKPRRSFFSRRGSNICVEDKSLHSFYYNVLHILQQTSFFTYISHLFMPWRLSCFNNA